MKKIITFIVTAMTAMTVTAKDYTCPLTVSVNGTEVPAGDITVTMDEQQDGKYTLSLLNFTLAGTLPVGNIVVENVEADACGVVTALSTQQEIRITEGEAGTQWIGPALGVVPILLKAELRGDSLNALLNIAMSKEMNVTVQLGSRANEIGQIPNGGFEDFHTGTFKKSIGGTLTGTEPNGWHSFISASGSSFYVASAASLSNVSISNSTRPGSEGSHSVKFLSSSIGGIVANGTITTGRMNAGSMTADDFSSNYAYTDFSKTDLDGNGDPFYTVLTGKPDSLKVWIKYGQGNPNASKAKAHPYATITAIITDGTRFQEPTATGVTYSNVVGEARNPQITSTGGEWREIVIPFTYDAFAANDVTPRALLATISTNADAGMGSANDSILVDDISLVYNAGLKSLKFKGTDVNFDESGNASIEGTGLVTVDDFVVETDAAGAYITKRVHTNENDSSDKNIYADITITSGDLKEAHTYTVVITGGTATSMKQQTITPAGVSAIYNVNGQQLGNMSRSGLYIVKKTNGTTVKVLKK